MHTKKAGGRVKLSLVLVSILLATRPPLSLRTESGCSAFFSRSASRNASRAGPLPVELDKPGGEKWSFCELVLMYYW